MSMKPNMANLFKQAQKMQDDMAKVQEALEEMSVEGSAGGGMVVATATGKGKITSVKIDPEIVSDDDIEMMEDMITAAVNQAIEKSQELANNEMQKVAGGMLGNLPPGMKLPGMG